MVNAPKLDMINSLQLHELALSCQKSGAPQIQKESTKAGEITGINIIPSFDPLGRAFGPLRISRIKSARN